MFPFLRMLFLTLVGLLFTAFGVFHAGRSYPGAEVFDHLVEALPSVGAALSFASGVLAAIAGVLILAASLYCLSRRSAPGRHNRRPTPRPIPSGVEFDPESFAGEDDPDRAAGDERYLGREYGGAADERRHARLYRH